MVLLNSNMKINGKVPTCLHDWICSLSGMLLSMWMVWWSWLARRTLHSYDREAGDVVNSDMQMRSVYSIRTTETAKTMVDLASVRRHWLYECKFVAEQWTVSLEVEIWIEACVCDPAAPTGPAAVGGRHSSKPPSTPVGVWMEPVNNNGEI